MNEPELEIIIERHDLVPATIEPEEEDLSVFDEVQERRKKAAGHRAELKELTEKRIALQDEHYRKVQALGNGLPEKSERRERVYRWIDDTLGTHLAPRYRSKVHERRVQARIERESQEVDYSGELGERVFELTRERIKHTRPVLEHYQAAREGLSTYIRKQEARLEESEELLEKFDNELKAYDDKLRQVEEARAEADKVREVFGEEKTDAIYDAKKQELVDHMNQLLAARQWITRRNQDLIRPAIERAQRGKAVFDDLIPEFQQSMYEAAHALEEYAGSTVHLEEGIESQKHFDELVTLGGMMRESAETATRRLESGAEATIANHETNRAIHGGGTAYGPDRLAPGKET